MFIQTESTPNPATLKFLPGSPVMQRGTANFTGHEDTARSSLARRLFRVDGVTGIFLGSDFITATKSDDRDWDVMKPEIRGAIMDHFTSDEPVIEVAAEGGEEAEEGEDDGIAAQIKELLDTRVRPAVAQDGGDIIFKGYRDGIVYLHMQGACSGCPSSTATLKHGIENLFRYYIPEVARVQAVE